MRLLRWWWLGCAIHFLGAYHSYFAFLTVPQNRHIYLWGRADWACALVSVAALGLLAACGACWLARRASDGSRGRGFLQLASLYALSASWGLFADATLADLFPELAHALPSVGAVSSLTLLEGAAKLAALAGAGYWAQRDPAALARLWKGFFFVFSPIIPIFFLQAAFFAPLREAAGGALPFSSRAAPRGPGGGPWGARPAAGVGAGGSVYLILFDAWSYRRTFAERQPRAPLVHLRRLADSALVLHSAFSPRTLTLESVPRLLSLRPLGVLTREHLPREDDMARVLGENLFGLAGKHGFRSYIAGSHIPYGDWFPGVAYASSVSHYRPPRGRPVARLVHTAWMLVRGAMPLQVPALRDALSRRHAEWLAGLNHAAMHADALAVLAGAGPRAFVFLHYPIPHTPVRAPRPGEDPAREPEGDAYFDTLRRVDADLGEIEATLRRAGRWDESLVIVTTDHAVFAPEEPETSACHIPAFIKLPGQGGRLDSDAAFDSRRLRGIIAAAFASGVDGPAISGSRELARLRSGLVEKVRACGPLPYPEL